MHGGHQAAFDAKGVVDDLGQRGETVGRAGGVGDDCLAGVAGVVHTVDEHRGVVLRRGALDDLFGTGVDVLLARFLGQEQAGRFNDDVGTDFVPLQFGRILDGGQTDFLAVDDQIVAFDGNLAFEAAMHGVERQHVGDIVRFEQIVDANNLNVVLEVLNSCAEDHSPDTTKTVDAYFDCHDDFPYSIKKRTSTIVASPRRRIDRGEQCCLRTSHGCGCARDCCLRPIVLQSLR